MSVPHINTELEGSPGGFIEAVKRTIVVSLRRSLNESGLTLNDSVLKVSMEYPFRQQDYPAAWVQFSFTSLQDSGLGHEQISQEGERVQQWMYTGRVTLTFMALSSEQRDKISDKFISIYAFSDTSDQTIQKANTPPGFLDTLSRSPYVSLSLKSGTLTPGGQMTEVGVPWDPDQLVYTDSYSFELAGEFQHVYKEGEGYVLRRIETKPTLVPGSFNTIKPGTYI